MRKRYLLIAGLVAFAAYQYVNRWGSTPAFVDSAGATIPGSVAEMHRFVLGGVEQSVTIRARSAKAPILIWLHGGPGMDATGIWRHHNAALEDHFIVVYWTQRGTGRSYHADIPAASMTLQQFVADLDQLVGILQKRFGQKKVVLAGHSWGTSVGVSYAQKHPEKVAAYVGVGQIASGAEGERRTYDFTLAEAKRRKNAEALAALTRIGPPPYSDAAMIEQRGWLDAFGGAWRKPTPLYQLLWTSFGASEMTWLDGVNFQAGQDFSLAALSREINGVDWLHTATQFKMPIFIIAGRYDHNTDARLAQEYFNVIKAPAKQFFWFEESAHSPPFEEPDKFNALMVSRILPVAQKAMAEKEGRNCLVKISPGNGRVGARPIKLPDPPC